MFLKNFRQPFLRERDRIRSPARSPRGKISPKSIPPFRAYTPVLKDGLYYVEIGGILPQNLDQQIMLTVQNGEGKQLSVTYGPMNYIVRMNEKGDDELKALLKALYNYHLAAKYLRVTSR